MDMKHSRFVGILLVAMLFSGVNVYAQLIRIQGHVTNEQGKSIPYVNIINPKNNEFIETADEEGRYNLLAEKNGQLKFTCVGYETKTIKVTDKQIVDVVLKDAVIELKEVEIVSQAVKKVVPEPTDIEIKGNYIHLKTRIPVPKETFSSHRRLVIQPSIYDVTSKKRFLMTPVVFDGKSYNTTQLRMYNYDIKQDPLHAYILVKRTSPKERDIITYYDSLYVDYLQHDYRADVHLAMENYRYILYKDSFSIARGTINPLRFLEYNFSAFSLKDDKYIPKPVMQLHDSKGEINLVFVVGKADLDDKNPQNKEELDRLSKELQALESNPDAAIQNFYITGIASPDGLLETNQKLAKRRTDRALKRILLQLNATTRKTIDVKSDAVVATWKDVSELLRKDAKPEIAEEVDKLIKQYGDYTYLFNRAIKSKPFYKIIANNYLPRLRKVQYTYEYTIFRSLTDKEIKGLYQKDPKGLSRFEFYRMIDTTSDLTEKEKYCKEAIEVYDNFIYAANELAVLNIQRNTPSPEILQQYVSKSAPAEVLSNQAIALLNQGKYSKADSVLSLAPVEIVPNNLKAIVKAMAGHYDESFEQVASTSPLNEVVMLLVMKKNKEAWEKCRMLNTGTAREYYVKAIAANRTDNLGDAIMCIEKALELDPSLLETAKIDADVLDLLPNEQIIKN